MPRAKSAVPELVDGSLPTVAAVDQTVAPVDETPFKMTGEITIDANGEVHVAGVNVHRTVQSDLAGYIPSGTIMPGGSKIRQR
jgi:hypothetical protein